MSYRITVERVGSNGTPDGEAWYHEAESALEALTVAADAIGQGQSGSCSMATVVDPTGLPVLVYTGHSQAAADADRG